MPMQVKLAEKKKRQSIFYQTYEIFPMGQRSALLLPAGRAS